MIYEVDVYKCKDGKIYVRADDEQQVWDYINNTDINEEDVVWDDYSDIDYLPIEENVRPVKRNDDGEIVDFYYCDEEEYDDDDFSKAGKKVPVVDLRSSLDYDAQPMFINECKNDDGCGGCPYYDHCALTQLGAWLR